MTDDNTLELIELARRSSDVDWRAVALDYMERYAAIARLADGERFSLERKRLNEQLGDGNYVIRCQYGADGKETYLVDPRYVYCGVEYQHTMEAAIIQALRAVANDRRKKEKLEQAKTADELDAKADELEAELTTETADV